MSLNIKNDQTYKLVKELAKLTGESMTAAITEAVRERLNRLRHKEDSSLSTRLLAISKDCAMRIKEPWRSIDHGDLLYGKDGLPK